VLIARPKDTTLDYFQRRGFEVAVGPMRKPTDGEHGRGKEQPLDAIQRFKAAQREFIKVAVLFDLNPDASLIFDRRSHCLFLLWRNPACQEGAKDERTIRSSRMISSFGG
jgi:hypothetical protein